jgi:hypothetical protein
LGIPLASDADPVNDAPPAGDRANQVLAGEFAAIGVSQPINVYGAFNFSIDGVITGTLKTSAARSVAAFVPAVAGADFFPINASIVSTLLPPGAYITAITTTGAGTIGTVQLGGLSAAQIAAIATGSDAAAQIKGLVPEATIQLERTFDGGYSYVVAGVGGLGQPASYVLGAGGSDIPNPVSVVAAEPEVGVGYRFKCTAFTGAVSVRYRLSISGLAAMAWGIPTG